jgi:hypothetical protein
MGEARGAGGDARRAALLAADEAVGRVVECLRRRRIQADGLYILTSDPRTPPSGELPLRGVLGIQFPFEYRSGSVCPTAASAADLAPTIVETVRGTPQPAWRGRSRRADVQHFQSSGPAVAGPFPVGAGSAWVAEEGGQVLVATPEGAMIAYRGGGSPPERLASAVRAAVH